MGIAIHLLKIIGYRAKFDRCRPRSNNERRDTDVKIVPFPRSWGLVVEFSLGPNSTELGNLAQFRRQLPESSRAHTTNGDRRLRC